MAPLVLFDIDGTLLTFRDGPPGPGRTSLNRAMHDLFGIERATEGMRVAGGTDLALARGLLSRAGAPVDDGAIERVLERYLHHLQIVVQTRCYWPLGDVLGSVAALRARGAMVGLATGNVRRGAAIKLGSAGLLHAFDLDHGGYGSDAEPRADILRTAVVRCSAGRADMPVVVVGDTEHDVRAARAIGAKVVGVAGAEGSRQELVTAGADAIVEDCGEALVREVFALAAR